MMEFTQAHDHIVSGLTHQPTRSRCVAKAATEIESRLRHYGIPNNLRIIGLVLEPLQELYNCGERRGAARETNPVSALFPVDQANYPFTEELTA